MSQSDCANAEFIKPAQQIQIVPEWLDAFHGDEKADLFGIERPRNFLMRPTNDAALRLLSFGVKPGDLIKGYLQAALGKISIFNVDRSANDPHPAGFELGQKFRGQYIWLITLFIEIHRQIEVHVDDARRM